MKLNYENFLKLVQDLVDTFNDASEQGDLSKMLSSSFAFRELLIMEARNLDEHVCKQIHGKLMKQYLEEPRIFIPSKSGIIQPSV